jgi:hypothetical protein
MVSLMLISQRMPHHESLGWGTDEGRDNRARTGATLKPKGGGRTKVRPEPGSAERWQRQGGPTAKPRGDATLGQGWKAGANRKPI